MGREAINNAENSWILEANLQDDIVRGCYNKTVTHATGLWKAENALLSTLPLFFVQLALIMFFTHLFRLLLSPFHQPPVVAHILGGIVMGPSLIGRTMFSRAFIFPITSILTLETMANLGLIYHMFLTGLEVDFKPILNTTKRVWTIAIAGIVIPIPLGYILHKTIIQKALMITSTTDPAVALQKHGGSMYGPIFWGITLATTNFSELAGVLADVKLLHSEVGRTALSMSVITDLASWLLLVITVSALSNGQVYTVFSTTVLIIFCVFALRPALSWIAVNTNFFDGNNKFDMDQKICFVMAGVMFFGFITDAMGSHSILGAFLFGAILPKAHLKHAIIERVEEFVSSFMLPLFFVTIGLRTYVHTIFTATNTLLVVAIVVSAFLTKLIVTFVAALLNKMSFRDSLALGVVINTKGLLAAVVLNAGRNLKVLDQKTFSLMTVATLIMTAVVGPILKVIYKSTSSSSKKYRRRSIQLGNYKQSAEEFRILTCIHSTSNVNGIISLLKASNPTKESPISAFAVHLVEHSAHASAMLILHNTSSSICKTDGSNSNSNSSIFKNNHVAAAFEKFETESEEGSVSVEAMTILSSYSSMHEDICNIAEEKHADLIIVPFHNPSTVDGGDMIVGNISTNNHRSQRWVNTNLLESAPCPVAIFVDRGLAYSSSSNVTNNGRCAMLFIGGPDDREALAYAWRMATTGSRTSPNNSHVITSLTLVRFIPTKDAAADYSGLDRISSRNHYDHVEDDDKDKIILQGVIEERRREKQLDEQYIERFIVNTRNQAWIKVKNEVVSNVEETLRVINEMGSEYGLYIVGRGLTVSTSPITFGLSEWGDWPELGPLGDTLVSSKFVANASVLIVHQGATLADQ